MEMALAPAATLITSWLSRASTSHPRRDYEPTREAAMAAGISKPIPIWGGDFAGS